MVELDLSNETEAALAVELEAQNLDRGEAQSAAIAIVRHWAIATDDKRAVNVIGAISPATQIVTTPELLKWWAEGLNIPEVRVKQAIQAVRRYVPPKNHPLLNWWQQHL